jgi:hypothetical protein
MAKQNDLYSKKRDFRLNVDKIKANIYVIIKKREK